MATSKTILDNAPTKDMTQEGLTTFRRVYDRSVLLVSSMEGAKAELISLNRDKSPFSPDNINRRQEYNKNEIDSK